MLKSELRLKIEISLRRLRIEDGKQLQAQQGEKQKPRQQKVSDKTLLLMLPEGWMRRRLLLENWH